MFIVYTMNIPPSGWKARPRKRMGSSHSTKLILKNNPGANLFQIELVQINVVEGATLGICHHPRWSVLQVGIHVNPRSHGEGPLLLVQQCNCSDHSWSMCITMYHYMYHYVCQFLELVAKCFSPDMGRSRESREKKLGTGVSMEASFDAGWQERQLFKGILYHVHSTMIIPWIYTIRLLLGGFKHVFSISYMG